MSILNTPQYKLFTRLEKCLEQGGGWLDIDRCDWNGSDAQSVFMECENYNYIFEQKQNIKFRFFYDNTAVLAYDTEDRKNIVRYWAWGFTYQGIDIHEIDKDTYRIFELNRKYSPKYIKKLRK